MAADVAVLVSSCLDDGKPTNLCISTLLESVSERQCLQGNGCTKEWIGKLNALLNSNLDRWLGIALLETTLQQCSTEVFTANCISWMKAIQNILEFSDLMRSLANSTVPAILTSLLSFYEKDAVCSLVGISACLKYFPGQSSQVKTQIEECLMTCLDKNNVNIRKYCAHCFALVAALNNNFSNDKQRRNWDMQWYRVIGTIDSTLDMLPAYESTKASFEIRINETLPVKVIETDEPKKTNTCTARLRSLLNCLDAMIREGTRRVNMVPLNDTITLLERIVSLNEKLLKGSVSLDNVILQGCLPLIHHDAIHLLCSLVQRCGSLLLPHANRVATMIVNELSWTSDVNSVALQNNSMRPYSNLRCAVYQCLLHFGQLNGSFHTNVIKDITSHLIKDIKVSRNSETKLRPILTEGNKQRGLSKKGKKRKLQAEIEQLSTNPEKIDVLCNEKLCHSALSALYSFMMDFGDNMNLETFQEIQVTLLEIVSQFQSSSLGASPQSYNSPECRKEVYHCLLACVLARPQGAPNAITCVIKFLTDGLQDSHFKVSNYCREALTIAAALIHPVVPSIDIAAKPLVFTNHKLQENVAENNPEPINSFAQLEPARTEEESSEMIIITQADQPDIQNLTLDSSHNLGKDAAGPKRSQSVHEFTMDKQNRQPTFTDSSVFEQGIDNSIRQSETTLNNNELAEKYSISEAESCQSERHGQKLPFASEDMFVISENAGTSSVISCDNINDGIANDSSNSKKDDNFDFVPAKKAKTDDYSIIDSHKSPKDDTESGYEQAEIQESDDVNEMLASFVNSSPDSE